MSDVDEDVDVGDVDLAVTVHVGFGSIGIPTQDDVDDGIDIGDAYLAVKVHITGQVHSGFHLYNPPEIGIPVPVGPVGIHHAVPHMQRAA